MPVIEGEFVLGADYRVDLGCRIAFTRETQLTGLRLVTGQLDQDTHTAEVVFPDDSVVPLLLDGDGPDTAERLLPPGEYLFRIHVYAHQIRSPGPAITPYSGRVVLRWEMAGDLPVQPVDWNSLKASYRR